MLLIFKTLFAKLAGTLVAVSLVLSAALLLMLRSSHESFHLEVEQKLHRSLAERVISHFGGGESALQSALAQIRELAILNPVIAAYVIDPEGVLTASSRPAAEVQRKRVSVGPIVEFLAGREAWPILGDDPASPRGKAIFSAAPVQTPSGRLYFYVVLGSSNASAEAMPLGDRSHSLREALWLTIANVVAALLAALIVVGLITRPVKRLRSAMEAFDASGFAGDARYQAPASGVARDEIDRLGAIFDSMADRIATQFESLRRSDEARRELYANVSHDLGTPLTSLHGYVETLLMKDAALSPDQRKRYLDILHRQTVQLRELVDQITDLARLEKPDLKLQSVEVRMDELLASIAEDLSPLLESKGLKLQLELTAAAPPLRGDTGLLRRALANIIVNATQAAPDESHIGVRVSGDDSGNVAVTVADRGPGLPAEETERLFKRGYRGSQAVRPGSPGMGLGLAIARKVIELHGGTLFAANAPEGGAVLRVTLPSGAKPSMR